MKTPFPLRSQRFSLRVLSMWMLAALEEVQPHHQRFTYYVAVKWIGEERDGKRTEDEKRGGIFIYTCWLMSPSFVFWTKSGGFSWIFFCSCLLYSLRFGAVLKSRPENLEGKKKQEIHCLMSHPLSSDPSQSPCSFLTFQSFQVRSVCVPFCCFFFIVISGIDISCANCILELEALTGFLSKYLEASISFIMILKML